MVCLSYLHLSQTKRQETRRKKRPPHERNAKSSMLRYWCRRKQLLLIMLSLITLINPPRDRICWCLCIINTYLNCCFSPQVQEFLYFFLRPFSYTRFRGGRHFESTQLHACAVALWHARYGHKTCSRQGWTFTHSMRPATCRFPSLPRQFFQNRTTSERGPKTEK